MKKNLSWNRYIPDLAIITYILLTGWRTLICLMEYPGFWKGNQFQVWEETGFFAKMLYFFLGIAAYMLLTMNRIFKDK